jgi:hypothetical protein
MPHRQVLRRYLPVLTALLAFGLMYYVVSAQFAFGSPWPVLGVIVLLGGLLVIAIRFRRVQMGRLVGFIILGIVTAVEAVSTGALIVSLITSTERMATVPHETALELLRDAALIWLMNSLTFSFWYWEIDGGGPAERHHHGYHSTDFVFPQMALAQADEEHWVPHFVDYLFLAFNTSTAFSPTDTLVLSKRAKILMMIQSLISLCVLAIIAARAINTL